MAKKIIKKLIFFVFYCCFGPLTRFASLEQTAVVARVLAFILLAWGWIKLTAPLLPGAARQCLALSLFLLMQALINFSGEWLVGGAEAKVFSYGFGFWALGTWQEGNSRSTALLLGLAVAFHSLVGCWLTIAVLFDYFWQRRQLYIAAPMQLPLSLLKAWREILIWIFCSLPGLLPSLLLLFSPLDAWTKFAGNYLQVYYRLKHHLDPMEFETWRYLGYGIMFLVALLAYQHLRKALPKTASKARTLFNILGASLLIASVGVLLGVRFSAPGEMIGLKWRIALLKFYPFRLFDLLTPVISSIFITALLTNNKFPILKTVICPHKMGECDRPRRWFAHACWSVLFAIGLFIPFADHNPSRMPDEKKENWLEICQWIRNSTSQDCVVITPGNSWAFKWYAQRAEYVSVKDCPQDAPGIVEWNARLTKLRLWKKKSYADRYYDRKETATLARQTQADFLIAERFDSLEIAPVFENPGYRIYQLTTEPRE